MKTLIIYYSYSGKTKTIAEKLASEEKADLAEAKAIKNPGKLKAYTVGVLAAGNGKAWEIEPLDEDLAAYDRLILLAPIWGGNPAPPFNAILKLLPKGKAVAVKMVSMSGKSACKGRIEAAIKYQGCVFEGFEDVKAKGK
jgi:flavodoxin